jgi:hypothetical protein
MCGVLCNRFLWCFPLNILKHNFHVLSREKKKSNVGWMHCARLLAEARLRSNTKINHVLVEVMTLIPRFALLLLYYCSMIKCSNILLLFGCYSWRRRYHAGIQKCLTPARWTREHRSNILSFQFLYKLSQDFNGWHYWFFILYLIITKYIIF